MAVNPAIFAGAITAATTHSQRVNSLSRTDVTVVNKNIVYKDTVLPLKELGENIKITSISDVEEFWLEKCLNKIFESNKDVIFNTVQYSKKDKKVYFYTDKNISTKVWDDRHLVNYQPLNNTTAILEEIKNILLSENDFDENSVSLYDVASLIQNRKQQLKKIEKYYQNLLKRQCESIYYKFSGLVIYGLDYDKSELKLGINVSGKVCDYQEVVFAKNGDDLYLKSDSTEYRKGRELFLHCSSKINECYNELMKFKEYKQQVRYGFRTLNSCLFFDICNSGVSIHNEQFRFRSNFDIQLSSDRFEYSYDVNSNSILEIIRGNEDNIFRNIFVNISDCPEWMQEELHSLRINQLEEEQRKFEEEQKRLEEERMEILNRQEQEKQKEMKKQKRLELIRKLNPFRKN